MSRYRYFIPNIVTFTTLTLGLVSVLLSTRNELWIAGVLMFTACWLDLLDGTLARKLDAGSNFGAQLDTIADIVSLCMASVVLVFQYLQQQELNTALIWIAVIVTTISSAFRLARFGQIPRKSGDDSLGLSLSVGGSLITLAVLSDIQVEVDFMPDFVFIPWIGIINILMVSRIPFPPFFWIFSNFRRVIVFTILFVFCWMTTSFFTAWLFWISMYVLLSLVRAALKMRQ